MCEKIKYGSSNEIPVWISSNLWKDSADIYISAVERLTLDAEQNDLQHVPRAACAVMWKPRSEAGLNTELQYLHPHNRIGLQ